MTAPKVPIDGVITVLTIPGPRAVQTNVSAFCDLVAPHLAPACPRIVFDMTQVEFIDSAFIGAMMMMLKQVVAKEGDIKLFGFRDPVQTLFELLRLHRVFDIHDSEESARMAFQVNQETR